MFDFNSYLMAGRAGVQDRQAREAEQRTNKLAALAGDAFAAPPGAQRDNALSTAMRLDPNAGVALQGAVRTDEDARNQSLANMARLLTTAPEPSRPGLYQQMRPSLQRLGVQAPEQYDDTVAQTAQAIAQAFGADQPGAQTTATMRSLQQAREQGVLNDEQYAEAVRVQFGLNPRAQADRFSVQKITMPDGSTGVFQVPTQGTAAGGQWMPGAAMPGLGGAPMPQRQAPAPMPNANPQPGGLNINLAGMEPASVAETISRIEQSEGRRLTQQEIAQAFASAAGPAAPASAGGPQVVQPGMAPPRQPAAPAPMTGSAFAPLDQVGGGSMGLGQTGAQRIAEEAESAGMNVEQQELARQGAERLEQIRGAARISSGEMASLDELERQLGQINTGAFATTRLQLGRAGAYLGINDGQEVAAAEAAQSIANRLALQLRNPAGGEGMPGAMSDADRDFLVSTIPSIANTPEGWRTMISIRRRLAQGSQDQAREAERFIAAGGRARDLPGHMARYAEQNRMLDEFRSATQAGQGSAPQDDISDLIQLYGSGN
jgi:hypothetical protein